MDKSLSQTRIELENLVDNTLATTATFYKKALPLIQEMVNSCSIKVHFDELWKITRNQYIKCIAAKGVSSTYRQAKGIVLFGKDKISKKSIPRHKFAHQKKSKSNEISKNE